MLSDQEAAVIVAAHAYARALAKLKDAPPVSMPAGEAAWRAERDAAFALIEAAAKLDG